MYKYRLTFSKNGYAKYVSHLDLMRMFQRAFKRAGLPISYSNGFNPHPKISIGFPLPLGVTGSREYMDIELDEQLSFEQLCADLNRALPPDIRILEAAVPNTKTSALQLAVYTVQATLVNEIANIEAQVEALLGQDEIWVDKKTKKGIVQTNIKPSVKEVWLQASGRMVQMRLTLSCADGASLKAGTFLEAMGNYIPAFKTEAVSIHREGLFLENMTEIS